MPQSNNCRDRVARRIIGNFMILMWSTGRQFVQMLQDFGMTPHQFWALAAAINTNPIGMGELTKMAFQDAPTMTGVIDRLVKTGMVARSRSETDRRVVLVEPTPAGIQTFEQIKIRMVREGMEGFDMFTTDELVNIEKFFSYFLRNELSRLRSYDKDELDRHLRKVESFLDMPINYEEDSVSRFESCEATD